MPTNSIDEKQQRRLRQFYEKRIAPLSEHEQMQRLEHAPPDSGDTFFVSRKQTSMQRSDFELRFADERQAAETLEALWQNTPLSGLPRHLMKLSQHFAHTQQSAQVSAFIYEMF